MAAVSASASASATAVATALSKGDATALASAFASATTQDTAKAQASAIAQAYLSGEPCWFYRLHESLCICYRVLSFGSKKLSYTLHMLLALALLL